MISATRSAGEGRFDDDEAVRSENVRTEDESPFIYIHIYRPDWTRLSQSSYLAASRSHIAYNEVKRRSLRITHGVTSL